jgi:lysophospholipase L1-like esterase
VQVVNGGVGGYTSFETLVDLALRVLEVEPDLLVIYHNTNDVHARLVPPDVFRGANTGYRHEWWSSDPWWDRSLIVRWLGVQWGFSPRNTLEQHTKVVYAEERDMADCLERNDTRWFARNTEEMIVLARARGAKVMLTSFASCPERGGYAAQPHYRRGFAENDRAMRALAERMDAPFYDFAAEMPLDLEYWADGVHNTAAGARRKAELFAAFIAVHFLQAVPHG